MRDRSGDWLCLKNVHLAVSWLPTLEKEMYTLQKNEGFRLLLTSESHSKFPKTLLEGALKITFEGKHYLSQSPGPPMIRPLLDLVKVTTLPSSLPRTLPSSLPPSLTPFLTPSIFKP